MAERHFMQRRGPNSSLYVRPIDASTRPDEIKQLFAEQGKIRDVHIPIDFNTRQPRGFAYIEYESIEDAERAQGRLNKTKLNDTLLHVDFAQGDRKTPGQMKTQKEAVALRLQIDELRARQEDQRRKARNQEMEREGIPTSGQDRSRGRRFNTPPRGRHDPYGDRRNRDRRDDRSGGGGGPPSSDRGRRDDDRRRPHGGDRREPVRDDRRGGGGEKRRDRSRSAHRGERDRDDRKRNFQEDRGSGHDERSRQREDHREHRSGGSSDPHRSSGRGGDDRGGERGNGRGSERGSERGNERGNGRDERGNGRDERGDVKREPQDDRRSSHYGHDDRTGPPRGAHSDQSCKNGVSRVSLEN